MMRLTIRELGEVVDEVWHENLICTAGITQVACAVLWAMAQDQNVAMGNPLSAAFLYPIYGAVGSTSTAANQNDTILGTELGRTVVAEASCSGGVVLLTFFFPTTSVDWSITEVGVFVSDGGNKIAGATSGSGLLMNHAVFGAVTKTAAQTATLQAAFTF